MKLIISKSDLLKGVQIVSKAVSSKTTMSILECILIDATKGNIRLVANDMELGIQTVVEGLIAERGIIALESKVFSEIVRKLPDSDIETLLVLDATTGQNAVNQARDFKEVADISGIVLTKLDGTARGGVVLAIMDELKIPVKYIGVGEQIDDLQPFDPDSFAEAIFSEEA